MATTALYVEILVIGALAELWIIVMLAAICCPVSVATLKQLSSAVGPLTTLLVLPLLALTYTLGWIVNFMSERLFKPFFQKQIRHQLFTGELSYDAAKVLVLHKGSPELVRDVLFDRHIIRIARANVVNFACLGVALLLHVNSHGRKLIIPLAILSVFIAVVSFFQWLARYRSHYKRISDTATALASG